MIHSFYQTDHSTLYWMFVEVNWLTLCQKCRIAVFWAFIVPPVHFGDFWILKNKLISYADDFALMVVVPSRGVSVKVAKFLICDLRRVSEWCNILGMKLNASKAKTMIVSRSRTISIPSHPTLTIDRIVQKQSDNLVIFGKTFVSEMTFEKHLHSVSRAAFQRLGILRPVDVLTSVQ